MTIIDSHMQAIRTVFLCPTNSRGARIKATAAAGSVTVPYTYDHTTSGAHAIAAQALIDKLGWKGDMIGGCLPDGSHCFVFTRRGE